jgi:hypothetical protein
VPDIGHGIQNTGGIDSGLSSNQRGRKPLTILTATQAADLSDDDLVLEAAKALMTARKAPTERARATAALRAEWLKGLLKRPAKR